MNASIKGESSLFINQETMLGIITEWLQYDTNFNKNVQVDCVSSVGAKFRITFIDKPEEAEGE